MQYIYTMNGVSKIVPPKRQIIKDISLSFFPGAKIGLLGLNGAGKSTVLKDDAFPGRGRGTHALEAEDEEDGAEEPGHLDGKWQVHVRPLSS